jgi:perosamine synthetase
MKYYPVARPNITRKEKDYVLKVLNSGFLSLGPVHKKFEKKFAKLVGTKYACSVSSGTAGLHLAVIAAGIKKGDEVITTPFSFISSANCILYVGAKPVFVDIDPMTYNLDPKLIEKAITKKTKAILVVHIFGQSCDMAPIQKIAKKHKLKIIEDACESLLATYRGKKVGTFGQSAVFAFYPNKQITTGEGGMIVTDDKKIYDLCVSLRNQGRTPNMQWLDHKYLGYNYRMDEMNASVGLAQLERINYLIKERNKVAALYNKYLADYQDLIQIPQIAKENKSTWFVYVTQILKKGVNRNRVIARMAKQKIQTKPYLPAIHLFDFYKKKFKYQKGDFPVTEQVSNLSLALPFYIGLNQKDIKYIVSNLIKILTK